VDSQISIIGTQLTMHQADAKKRSAAAYGPRMERADIQARSRKRQKTARGEVVDAELRSGQGSRTLVFLPSEDD